VQLEGKTSSIASLLPKLVAALDSPVIGVVDGGHLYDSLVDERTRGGSWNNDSQYARAAYRNYDSPGNASKFLVFRLALPVER